MLNITIFFVILYIGISLWALKYRKGLKGKGTWFIRNGWTVKHSWMWPISWQGHILWILFFLPIPLSLYFVNTNSLAENIKIVSIVFGLLVMVGIFFLAAKKSEGVLIKNDKWFDWLSNKIMGSNKGNKSE